MPTRARSEDATPRCSMLVAEPRGSANYVGAAMGSSGAAGEGNQRGPSWHGCEQPQDDNPDPRWAQRGHQQPWRQRETAHPVKEPAKVRDQDAGLRVTEHGLREKPRNGDNRGPPTRAQMPRGRRPGASHLPAFDLALADSGTQALARNMPGRRTGVAATSVPPPGRPSWPTDSRSDRTLV
jgi:hypothetical protein